ncbi:hypothetical protein SDC9_186918 [bioreactor metagenome]|uniref:Uncharacterized protein n=1 Tax=bioreactor metagenome TaxID=1076179 RepID=A0A645HKW8_9ZZZZ
MQRRDAGEILFVLLALAHAQHGPGDGHNASPESGLLDILCHELPPGVTTAAVLPSGAAGVLPPTSKNV